MAVLKRSQRIWLASGFFGTAILLMALQTSVLPAQVSNQPYLTCTKNDQCSGKNEVCDNGECRELADAVCTCSQPQVLQCTTASSRAKHTFCDKGCEATEDDADCIE